MDVNILKARCIIEYELLIKYSNELGINMGYNDDKFLEFKDEINANTDAKFLKKKLEILANKRSELKKEIERNKINNSIVFDYGRNHILMVASIYRLTDEQTK